MNDNCTITIRNASNISQLADAVHDAVFRVEDVLWDSGRNMFQLTMWRECEEIPSKPLLRIIPFIHKKRFRRVRCIMTWQGVVEASVRESSSIDHHCLTGITYSLLQNGFHSIRFQTEGAIELHLVANEFYCTCEDTGEFTDEQFGFVTLGRPTVK